MNPIELIGYATVAVLVLIGGLVLAYEKGLIGLSQERIDKMQARVDDWQAKLAEKLAKKAKPVAVMAAPKMSKAERIAENNALVAAGSINQAQADEANAAILKE